MTRTPAFPHTRTDSDAIENVDKSKDDVNGARFAVGEELLLKLQLKLKDEYLNDEIVCSTKELRVLCEIWYVHYTMIRPQCLRSYRLLALRTGLTYDK